MSDFEAYVEAAMIPCPRCRATAGQKCVVRACKNGYQDCTYAACAYWKELDEPHLERAVAARKQAVAMALRDRADRIAVDAPEGGV